MKEGRLVVPCDASPSGPHGAPQVVDQTAQVDSARLAAEGRNVPFAQVRDIRLYYEIQGRGPRLLFISGSGSDLRRPRVVGPRLAEHFELLEYDQRGQGQTDHPDVPCTMADYAEDAAALLDVVGWDRCLVIGVSFGGMVAQELVLRHPGCITRLVLWCTSSGGAGGKSYPIETLSSLPHEERARRIVAILDTRHDAAWQTAHPNEFRAHADPLIAQWKSAAMDPQSTIGSSRQMEARAGHDTYARLPRISIPVYICGGRYDGLAFPTNIEASHRAIPGSHLEFFEGGHLFFLEDPRVIERTVAFLADRVEPVTAATAERE